MLKVHTLRDLTFEERLKECGVTTLETRRLRGDLIEVFKRLNWYENIDRNMFFSLKKDSRTRGHEIKLVKDQCRLDVRKYSFSQRTINEWNKLSTGCVTASSVNMFKNKVETYLVHLPSGQILLNPPRMCIAYVGDFVLHGRRGSFILTTKCTRLQIITVCFK